MQSSGDVERSGRNVLLSLVKKAPGILLISVHISVYFSVHRPAV